MRKTHISNNLVKQVISLYNQNQSIIDTAKALDLSTVKVRKILITEGLWQSETSLAIGRLLEQGLSSEEIADELYMTVKNVQAYMPYERGLYKGEQLSQEAVRADTYRKRMKQAAAMQVTKGICDKSRYDTEEATMSSSKMIFADGVERYKVKRVLKLQCELDMKRVMDDEMDVLKRFGSMKKSISRDILVPADITLHALHYVLLRMFGWQNSHLHCYCLPDEVFDGLTEQSFVTWSRLAGVYFRFPTEDYDDIYWDDDYKEGISFKTWMKRKYTGPYRYKGIREHYIPNQEEVMYMFHRWPQITVREFSWSEEKEPYDVYLTNATIKQVEHSFSDMWCHEVIERLPLEQILYTPGYQKKDLEEIRKDLLVKLEELEKQDLIGEYYDKRLRFKSKKQEQAFFSKYNVNTYPVTDRLQYRYDYGDGWKVWITCTDAYELDEESNWHNVDHKSLDVLEDDLQDVAEKHRPVCIAKDGIELVDDIGGIRGFCEMLLQIYNADPYDEDEMDARDEMISWASMMGWTGRRISTKHTL